MSEHNQLPIEKADIRGVPSMVWRAGQERRLKMILDWTPAEPRHVLVDGCGIGTYVEHLIPHAGKVTGLDIEVDRVHEASVRLCHQGPPVNLLGGAGEFLPFRADSFDLVLSHEVLEHVQNDRAALSEIVRVLKPGGRLMLFCPNRGYPYETHGIYWRGHYRFGNIPLVNYLPKTWRNRLAPHVRVYSRGDLERLFRGLGVHIVRKAVIFGAYDNIIYTHPRLGRLLRGVLQAMEATPLQFFGLSHFWVVEKL